MSVKQNLEPALNLFKQAVGLYESVDDEHRTLDHIKIVYRMVQEGISMSGIPPKSVFDMGEEPEPDDSEGMATPPAPGPHEEQPWELPHWVVRRCGSDGDFDKAIEVLARRVKKLERKLERVTGRNKTGAYKIPIKNALYDIIDRVKRLEARTPEKITILNQGIEELGRRVEQLEKRTRRPWKVQFNELGEEGIEGKVFEVPDLVAKHEHRIKALEDAMQDRDDPDAGLTPLKDIKGCLAEPDADTAMRTPKTPPLVKFNEWYDYQKQKINFITAQSNLKAGDIVQVHGLPDSPLFIIDSILKTGHKEPAHWRYAGKATLLNDEKADKARDIAKGGFVRFERWDTMDHTVHYRTGQSDIKLGDHVFIEGLRTLPRAEVNLINTEPISKGEYEGRAHILPGETYVDAEGNERTVTKGHSGHPGA